MRSCSLKMNKLNSKKRLKKRNRMDNKTQKLQQQNKGRTTKILFMWGNQRYECTQMLVLSLESNQQKTVDRVKMLLSVERTCSSSSSSQMVSLLG